MTCHMGNFEMLTPAIYKTGLKGYVIYRSLDFKPLDRLIQRIRRRFGVTVIPTQGAFKQVEAALSRGGIVGTLLDTNVSWHKGVLLDFSAGCLYQPGACHTGIKEPCPGGTRVYGSQGQTIHH